MNATHPKSPELCSRYLSAQEIRTTLESLPTFFREFLPDSILTAEYGFGCRLHTDLCYQPMRVGVGWLDRFITESIEQRIFVPGSSDMTIATPEDRFTILFCHEADIHISGADTDLVRRFISTLPYANFQIRKA